MPATGTVLLWLLWVGIGAIVGNMIGGTAGAVGGTLFALTALLWLQTRRVERLQTWLEDPSRRPPTNDLLWQEINLLLSRLKRQHAGALARLESEVARFEAAGQAIPEGVIALDRERRILWINRLAAQHFALDPRGDRGNLLTHLVRDPELTTYMSRGGFSEPLLLHPGHQPGLALQIFVVEFGDAQRLIVSRDVSDRERVERMRRDFVANVSHELRTPITVVSGFVETLSELERAEAASVLPNVLPLLQSQMQRMQNLVSDLLTLAQLECTGQPPPMAAVDMPAMLQSMVAEANTLDAGRHIIDSRIEPDLQVCGAPTELRSIAGNLLNNALRYAPEGSRITVQWGRSAGGGDATTGVLSVRDEGPGIAAEHLPRLTERFYRVDSGRSRETGGTGLGLAIVKHALTHHGGHLEIESQPGVGSDFRAVFPAERLSPRETGR